MTDLPEDPEAFWALFKDELDDPNALSLEEIQRAMPVHGDTRATMIARNNRNNPKRLTSAELAAEYWRASLDLEYVVSNPDDAGTWNFTAMNEDVRRALILERFATLPHYDEEVTR